MKSRSEPPGRQEDPKCDVFLPDGSKAASMNPGADKGNSMWMIQPIWLQNLQTFGKA